MTQKNYDRTRRRSGGDRLPRSSREEDQGRPLAPTQTMREEAAAALAADEADYA